MGHYEGVEVIWGVHISYSQLRKIFRILFPELYQSAKEEFAYGDLDESIVDPGKKPIFADYVLEVLKEEALFYLLKIDSTISFLMTADEYEGANYQFFIQITKAHENLSSESGLQLHKKPKKALVKHLLNFLEEKGIDVGGVEEEKGRVTVSEFGMWTTGASSH